MSDYVLLSITGCCLVGIFVWVLEWAKSTKVDIDYPDTEFPNEEDE